MKNYEPFLKMALDIIRATCVNFQRRSVAKGTSTSTICRNSLEGKKMRTEIAPKRFKQDNDKLKELIIYIAEKSVDDMYFEATKLNKILFFCDMLYYGMYGKPITGADYFAIDEGPAPRQMVPIMMEMEKRDKTVRVITRQFFNHEQNRVIPLRDSDPSKFSGQEIAFIDSIIDRLKDKSAGDLVKISHKYPAYKLTPRRDSIPYELIFISQDPPSPEDHARGLELAKKYGWKI